MKQRSARGHVHPSWAVVFMLALAALAGTTAPSLAAHRPAPAQGCPPCDDGNACTTDACDEATGVCTHQDVVCDDGNACTTDSCDPATGCTTTPVAAGTACDDANTCTSDDVCDGAGLCVGTRE